ncbi:hypothetical protein OG223_01270 [Streptomyces sp. NBC_01478]|uniref:hypothetical protein n=1 Tax=Streptomyces sp. NBC_01478 TaxID=2903882 RepID=UPI002E36E75A|nr:hypothetical protein [Streptomyces sp. NBC_01478]
MESVLFLDLVEDTERVLGSLTAQPPELWISPHSSATTAKVPQMGRSAAVPMVSRRVV